MTSQPDLGRVAGPPPAFPPAYPPPSMPFAPPAPTQRHQLATPFRDGFLVGLGFVVASLVPLAGLIVLVVTLAGIGAASQ